MATDFTRERGDSELIVFASTSEEATFADGVYKFFYFVDDESLATLSTLTSNFDTSTFTYSLTFAASDISAQNTESNVDVIIGGIE